MSRGRPLPLGAALVALVAGLLGACDAGGTECDCPAAGLTVDVPMPLAAEVTAITPSGVACANAVVSPSPSSDARVHALVFRIEPTQAGACAIDIDFRDGTTFSDDLTVVETTGCCAGLRTSPAGAAVIDVPLPGDAG